MNIDTLEGRQLDLAVASLEGTDQVYDHVAQSTYHPSTDWALGGPIIERERISVVCSSRVGGWSACHAITSTLRSVEGPTPLIAAMRFYVKSKLGVSRG